MVMMRCAYLFPGQGAQFVGMGATAAASHPSILNLYTRASDILQYDLLETCRSGPETRLNSTAVCQPAIFVASMAAVELRRILLSDSAAAAAPERSGNIPEKASVALGLSVGEYAALAHAGVFDFETGVRLTMARGRAMQAAADSNSPNGMTTVSGLELREVEDACRAASASAGGEPIEVANLLAPRSLVVSGGLRACEAFEREVPSSKRLAVAGAFHTEYMRPAVEPLAEALREAEFSPPRIPVISNVTARPHDATDVDSIRALLLEQVVSRVRWEESVRFLLDEAGLERSFELGPGRSLSAIMRRIHRRAKITAVSV